MKNVHIYSTNNCPNCILLKKLIEMKNISYKEINMATPEALTELSMNGIFTTIAPVLQIGNKFYTYNELFKEDKIDNNKLETILNI